jgi:hypothetical protein
MGSKFTEVGARVPAPEWFTGIVSRWNSHSGSYGYILRDSDGRKVIAYTRECPGGRPLGAGRRVRFRLDSARQGWLPLIALDVEYVRKE